MMKINNSYFYFVLVFFVFPFLLACGSGDTRFEANQLRAPFEDPQQCQNCHPEQYEQWSGSPLAYGAISPVFNALESIGNELTNGAFAKGGEDEYFCLQCHSPVSTFLSEVPEFDPIQSGASVDFMSRTGKRGVTCDVCHQILDADHANSLKGDGIGNAAIVFNVSPTEKKMQGPFEGAEINDGHAAVKNSFISSSEFCGTCHDVRIEAPDVVTGESFRRVENTFTEWADSPYATTDNPYGKIISCQDCHMSMFPYELPGTYATGQVAQDSEDRPVRKISNHYFSGVDIALIEDFPNQKGSELDPWGMPRAQHQRRTDLLKAAAELDIRVPNRIRRGNRTLPITVSVTNVGAGHGLPTGFSQERELWIELTVVDRRGRMVYESGFLRDKPHPEMGEIEPDGRLNDEDLENTIATFDIETTFPSYERGPDYNQRPERNLGLISFSNAFKRYEGQENGEYLKLVLPFGADHMDNSYAIPALETVESQYDVPLLFRAASPLTVKARLRFRAFPPKFLRFMAQKRPGLVTEAMVDRNEIIDMAEVDATVNISR